MSVLVINVGSSSLKYALFEEGSEKFLHEGTVGIDDHFDADEMVKKILRNVSNIGDLQVIAHRIVHGGEQHKGVEEVTQMVLKELEPYNFLAPLHNPHAVAIARSFLEFMPRLKHVAVFDSWFFRSLPPIAKLYALPRDVVEKYHIKRYGFHGISHEYACSQASRQLSKPFQKATFISLHLGGGSSACVVHQGKPLDVSMGFTPLEGLPMMTRSGDVDAGIIIFLLKTGHYTAPDLDRLLNEESGLKGISGQEDFLSLLRNYQFDERSRLAFDFFVYHVRKYIGSYLAVAPLKPDAIIFTGEIGAGEPLLRKRVMEELWIAKGINVIVVPPNEELAIMRKVKENPKF